MNTEIIMFDLFYNLNNIESIMNIYRNTSSNRYKNELLITVLESHIYNNTGSYNTIYGIYNEIYREIKSYTDEFNKIGKQIYLIKEKYKGNELFNKSLEDHIFIYENNDDLLEIIKIIIKCYKFIASTHKKIELTKMDYNLIDEKNMAQKFKLIFDEYAIYISDFRIDINILKFYYIFGRINHDYKEYIESLEDIVGSDNYYKSMESFQMLNKLN